MSRFKKNRIVDSQIQKSILAITENQYSLSESDLTVLNEAIERLRLLKRKGKTYGQIYDEISKVNLLIHNILYSFH